MGALRLIAWIAFAAGIAWQVTRDVHFSPDSMHYVDIAKTIVSEGRIATYHLNLDSAEIPDGAIPWPPLYPLLLSLPMKAGCDAALSARILSMLAFVLTCIAGARLGSRLAGGAAHGLCFALLALLCADMEVFSFAWSEPPFIAFSLLFLLFCVHHIQSGSRRALVLAAVLGGMAFMTRYIGVAMTAVGVVALLQRHFHEENPHGRTRLAGNLLVFAFAFAAVSLPWLLRNYLMDGRAFGPPSSQSIENLSTNLLRTWDAVRMRVPLALAGLVAALGVFLMGLWRRQHRLAVMSRISDPRTALAWFIVSYAVILITLAMRYRIDNIDTRLLSPIFPPLVILAIATLFPLISSHASPAAARTVASVCAVSVALTALAMRCPPRPGMDRGPLVQTFATGRPHSADWFAANTEPDALLVGRWIWSYRFFTGRAVLECGYPSMPDLNKEGIDRFLAAHSNRFSNVYLIAGRGSDLDRAYEAFPTSTQTRSESIRKLSGARPEPAP